MAEPQDIKRLWAVLLEIKGDGTAIRRCLEGWVDDSGKHHPGLLSDHDRLKQQVSELEAKLDRTADRQTERRWAVAMLGIGAGITKVIDWLAQFGHSVGKGHP